MEVIYTEEWITANADRINWGTINLHKISLFSIKFKLAFSRYIKQRQEEIDRIYAKIIRGFAA